MQGDLQNKNYGKNSELNVTYSLRQKNKIEILLFLLKMRTLRQKNHLF